MKRDFHQDILSCFQTAFESEELIKVYVKTPLTAEHEFNWLLIRPVHLQSGRKIQFVYKYPTQDTTKNFTLEESKAILNYEFLGSFRSVNIFSTGSHVQYDMRDEKKLVHQKKIDGAKGQLGHDKKKSRLIPEEADFLIGLGVTSAEGKLKSKMKRKFIQVNRFIEILDPFISKMKEKDEVRIVDMGCGKGYLTFGLYHHLRTNKKIDCRITGIELRPTLVDEANKLSARLKFENLRFKCDSIETSQEESDIIIALHACDTATDDVIIKGIKQEAELIVLSPCCHQALRPSIKPTNALSCVVDSGIVLERQSEIITDTIRKLILECYNYKVSLIEYVGTEHTPKNLLLIAQKMGQKDPGKHREKLDSLKAVWGIDAYYLEKIFEHEK